MLAMHAFDQRLWCHAVFFGAQHDCVPCVSSAQTYQQESTLSGRIFESAPRYRSGIFDEMAEVDGAVGIGQGRGDEDFAGHGMQSEIFGQSH